MKQFKVAILTPTAGLPRMPYAFSLFQLALYYAHHRIYEDIEEQSIHFIPLEGSVISAARERLIDEAINKGLTHALFIDDDIMFAPNTLHKLASRNLSIVGCNYRHREPNGDFTALAPDKKSRIQTTEDSTGVELSYYTGFGFCLIDLSIFKELERPWFPIGYNPVTKQYTTEDVGLAYRLEKTDVCWYVDHDASKLISHSGFYNYTYKEK